MRIKSGQDLLTGLLFIVVGGAGLWIGADYPMGTAQRPGTGVLPYILSWCLIGTGGLLWIKAMLAEGPGLTGWAWRPIIMITLATIAFALLIDQGGLVVAMLVSMTLAALGTPETRWREYTVFAVIMIVIAIAMFIKGLGMPIPVWPTQSADWISSGLELLRGR
jgi:Tripartite tricarboxylate transporter TctB family